MNTDTFGAQISAIKRKYANKGALPMRSTLSFKNFNILAGQFDTDLIFSFTLQLGLYIEGGVELIYDELKMVVSANINSQNDMVFPTIINLKIEHLNDAKQQPIRNSLEMTAAEYREFISVTGFEFNFIKKYLNEVYMKDGLRFPYKADELETEIQFKNKLMYVMLDVKEKIAEVIE